MTMEAVREEVKKVNNLHNLDCSKYDSPWCSTTLVTSACVTLERDRKPGRFGGAYSRLVKIGENLPVHAYSAPSHSSNQRAARSEKFRLYLSNLVTYLS